jgi:hypothetical protein
VRRLHQTTFPQNLPAVPHSVQSNYPVEKIGRSSMLAHLVQSKGVFLRAGATPAPAPQTPEEEKL